MSDEQTEHRPIVRLTKWSVSYSPPRGRKKGEPDQQFEGYNHKVYGVDDEGVERVYAEQATEDEHKAWCATDPLWHEARSAMFARLLDNPKTRDLVLQINIKAALDKGDNETALTLLQALSPEALQRLLGKDYDPTGAVAEPPDSQHGERQATRTRANIVVLSDAAMVSQFTYPAEIGLSEGQVKDAVSRALQGDGWKVDGSWEHARGTSISATRDRERLVIEAKGEGSRSAARANRFQSALGELLQRMDSPDASYGLALPAHRQFVDLILRLPAWMRQHQNLSFYLVRPSRRGDYEVGVIPADVVL